MAFIYKTIKYLELFSTNSYGNFPMWNVGFLFKCKIVSGTYTRF